MKVVMAGAAGMAVGAAVGVGGYMMYQSMTRNRNYLSGTAYDQSWCQRPGGTGSVMPCRQCYQVYGSVCNAENGCYGAGGCDFKLGQNMERDDLMTAGFLPQEFKFPLTLTVLQIKGDDFKQSTICPKDTSGTTFDDKWAQAASVNVDLFVTLTQVETLPSDNRNGGTANGAASGAHWHASIHLPLLGLLVLLRLLRRH